MPESRRGALWGALIAFALFLALYLATFPLDSDGIVLGSDVTWYARNLARGDRWHPHHLLFHLAAGAVLRVREWLLPGEGPVYAALGAQRLLSAAAGAGIVALAFAFAARRLGALRGALIAGVLGLSTGAWFYSSVGETQAPALVFAGALLIAAAEERLGGRPRSAWLHASLLLLAVLMRQDAVLAVPAYLLLAPPRRGVVVVGAVGAVSLCLYALAWRLDAPPSGFVDWLLRLVGEDEWSRGGALTGLFWGLRTGVVGTMSALVYSPSLTAVRPEAWIAVLALAAAAAAGLRRGPARRPAARVAWGFAAFAAARFLFYTWWQPTNVEFHGATWIPLCLILAVVLAPDRAPRVQAVCLALALLATAAGTARSVILPHRGAAAAAQARRAIEVAGPGGAVLALDWIQDWALMREAPPDVLVERAVTHGVERGRAAIRAAIEGGGRALLVRDSVLAPRVMGSRALPPAPGLVAGLTRGFELRWIEVDERGDPWLVEVLSR